MSEANHVQRPGLTPGLAGNYYWDLVRDDWRWSAELYTIYGLSTGVTPTTELLLSLTHSEDRQQIAEIAEYAEHNADPFSCELRIRRAGDAAERRVVLIGEVHTGGDDTGGDDTGGDDTGDDDSGDGIGDDGSRVVRGFVIDVTDGPGGLTGASQASANDRLRRELTALRAQTLRCGERATGLPQGWLWIAPLPEPAAVVLAGEVALASRVPFTRALQELIVRSDSDVYLDLSNVEFIDVGGVEVLLAAARGLAEGRRLVVLEPKPGLRRILALMRVDTPENLLLVRTQE
jgi:anti-anti-sigma regulatory factor